MSYYSRKVAQIKKQIEKNNYPPKFRKEVNIFCHRNCYAYALDISVNDSRKKIFIPGCISNENEETNIFDPNDLKTRLRKDLDFLGFSYRTDDGKLEEGEYRIALYFEPTFHDWPIGFHISRQDEIGEWSEKPSWKAKVQKIGKKGDTPPDISKKGPKFLEVLIIKKRKIE